MECPECNGEGQIEVRHAQWMLCPTCEGEGVVPDEAAVKWCPACGEPISGSEEWCQLHAGAAYVTENQSPTK